MIGGEELPFLGARTRNALSVKAAGAKSLRVPTIVKSVNYTSARTCVRARVCVCDGEERPVGIESA